MVMFHDVIKKRKQRLWMPQFIIVSLCLWLSFDIGMSSLDAATAFIPLGEGRMGIGYDVGETGGVHQQAEYRAPDLMKFGTLVDGIDVSSYQGTIAWSQVYSAGYRFAFAKADEGCGYNDSKFVTNMTNGRNAGLLMGAYHFARPDINPNEAAAEANCFVSVAGSYLTSGYLRPVLDLETGDGLGWSALSTWAHTWLSTVYNATGIQPILYVNSYYANNLDASLTSYPLWVAHYGVSSPNPGRWSTWNFWQYSSTGAVSGISGNVDLDYFNGDLAALQNGFMIGGGTNLCGDLGGRTLEPGNYEVTCPIYVNAGSSLHIKPGVTIDYKGKSFTVNGQLIWGP